MFNTRRHASSCKELKTVSLPRTDLNGEHVSQTLDANSKSLRLTVVLPSYYMYLPDQHHHLHIGSSDESVLFVPPFDIPDMDFDWDLPLEARAEGEAILHVEGQVFFCPVSDATICIWATIDERFHVRVKAGSGQRLEIVHEVNIPDTLDSMVTSRVTTVDAADEN